MMMVMTVCDDDVWQQPDPVNAPRRVCSYCIMDLFRQSLVLAVAARNEHPALVYYKEQFRRQALNTPLLLIPLKGCQLSSCGLESGVRAYSSNYRSTSLLFLLSHVTDIRASCYSHVCDNLRYRYTKESGLRGRACPADLKASGSILATR